MSYSISAIFKYSKVSREMFCLLNTFFVDFDDIILSSFSRAILYINTQGITYSPAPFFHNFYIDTCVHFLYNNEKVLNTENITT